MLTRHSLLLFLALIFAQAMHAAKPAPEVSPAPSPEPETQADTTLVAPPKPERFIVGFKLNLGFANSINGASYAPSPGFGFNAVYRFLPFMGVGGSNYTGLLIPNGTGDFILDGAVLPEVYFFAGDTGVYASAGVGLATVHPLVGIPETLWSFVWGGKVGYQYRIKDSMLSIGPEAGVLFISAKSVTNASGVTTSVSAQQIINASLVGSVSF